MVGIALMMAMVVVLQFVGSMIPPIGGTVSISLVLIPIVVGSAVFGPGAGALLGATFGVITAINCMTGADPGGSMVFAANPLICVLVVMAKGMLAGAASGAVYKLLKGKNAYIAMFTAAVVCPVVNTGIFLACMAAFFMEVLQAWAGGTDVVNYLLTGSILVNFTVELIINVLFSPAAQRILHAVERK
jgi:uncharacterized membrane protein